MAGPFSGVASSSGPAQSSRLFLNRRALESMARSRPAAAALALGAVACLLAAASTAVSSAPRRRGAPPRGASADTYAWTRPAVVALGDSITEYALIEGGWWRGFAGNYSRKADCVNRGLSGYNSRWALAAVDEVVEAHGPLMAAALVWFGANDAKTPGTGGPQSSVPLEEYGQNLRAIARKLKTAGKQGRKGGGDDDTGPGDNGGRGNGLGLNKATPALGASRWPAPSEDEGPAVVIVTPPPLHEQMWLERMNARARSEGREDFPSSDRLNSRVDAYAAEARRAAEDAGAAVADVHRALTAAGAGRGDDAARLFFSDGLHLSPMGNAVALREMQRALGGTAAAPERLPVHLPTFSQVDANDPARGTFWPLMERGYGPADAGAAAEVAAAAAA